MDRLGQLQAQPAKDAHVAHALHHHHHARNEHDGGPVDAAGGLRCAVPEGALAEGGQVQGIPYGPAIVHTDTEYQHQHRCAAAQRHPLAGMRSSTISRNMMTKITNAASSATIGNSPLFRDSISQATPIVALCYGNCNPGALWECYRIMNFYLFADSLSSSTFCHIRMVEGRESFVVKRGRPQGPLLCNFAYNFVMFHCDGICISQKPVTAVNAFLYNLSTIRKEALT